MEKIKSLEDRFETDIEAEFAAISETGMHERLISTEGGMITRVSGFMKHLIVFHDGGKTQGSCVILVDGPYEIRLQRIDKASMRMSRTKGDETLNDETMALAGGDDLTLEASPGRNVTFRRYRHPNDLMEDLRRRADS
jgi:hypothetical protein